MDRFADQDGGHEWMRRLIILTAVKRAQVSPPFALDFGVNGQISARVGRKDLVLTL